MLSKGSYLLVRKTGQRQVSDKILAQRIKSCTSIYKITKAMKMVSASKMKGDLVRLDNGKDFAHQAVNMIFKCDTYMQRKALPETHDSRELIVPITSDRGLCGGINSGVIREIKSYLQTKNRKNMGLFVIGEKGAAASYRPFPDIFLENV